MSPRCSSERGGYGDGIGVACDTKLEGGTHDGSPRSTPGEMERGGELHRDGGGGRLDVDVVVDVVVVTRCAGARVEEAESA